MESQELNAEVSKRNVTSSGFTSDPVYNDFLKPINTKQDLIMEQNNKTLNQLNGLANPVPIISPLAVVTPPLESTTLEKKSNKN